MPRRRRAGLERECIALALILASPLAAAQSADPSESACASLQTRSFPNLRIESARAVPAGRFDNGDVSSVPAPTAAIVPASCRVSGSLTTSPQTSVAIEVWLPSSGWNGRFLANGYSFYGGDMDPVPLAHALRAGYATATTDGGGAGERGGSFLLGRPERLRDVAERAWHETVVAAKTLIRAYYGRSAEYAYFEGCGGEGRQGLAAAQLHPGDFDGIAVGGIANDTSHFAFAQMAVWMAAHETPASGLSPSELELVNRAALAACDADDGVADGLIADPPSCRFDPAVLQCGDAAGDRCLTPDQVLTVGRIYSPVVNPRTQEIIFGPLLPGSELAWTAAVMGEAPSGYAVDFFKYLVFADPDWDYRVRPLDLDADLARAERVHPAFNPVDPDLTAYLDRGGKLLLYGGWNDVAIPPSANTAYYESVVARMGGARVADSVRLFMVPGMGHCPGRFGPPVYSFSPLDIVRDWRESGEVPDRLIAEREDRNGALRTVLACPFPEVPTYSGAGSVGDATHFHCTAVLPRGLESDDLGPGVGAGTGR